MYSVSLFILRSFMLKISISCTPTCIHKHTNTYTCTPNLIGAKRETKKKIRIDKTCLKYSVNNSSIGFYMGNPMYCTLRDESVENEWTTNQLTEQTNEWISQRMYKCDNTQNEKKKFETMSLCLIAKKKPESTMQKKTKYGRNTKKSKCFYITLLISFEPIVSHWPNHHSELVLRCFLLYLWCSLDVFFSLLFFLCWPWWNIYIYTIVLVELTSIFYVVVVIVTVGCMDIRIIVDTKIIYHCFLCWPSTDLSKTKKKTEEIFVTNEIQRNTEYKAIWSG